MEKHYIFKIENALRGLRLGTKTPENCKFQEWNNKLRKVNDGLAEDFDNEYEKHVKNYNRKHNTQFSVY